jgi:hypothetical protein
VTLRDDARLSASFVMRPAPGAPAPSVATQMSAAIRDMTPHRTGAFVASATVTSPLGAMPTAT